MEPDFIASLNFLSCFTISFASVCLGFSESFASMYFFFSHGGFIYSLPKGVGYTLCVLGITAVGVNVFFSFFFFVLRLSLFVLCTRWTVVIFGNWVWYRVTDHE